MFGRKPKKPNIFSITTAWDDTVFVRVENISWIEAGLQHDRQMALEHAPKNPDWDKVQSVVHLLNGDSIPTATSISDLLRLLHWDKSIL